MSDIEFNDIEKLKKKVFLDLGGFVNFMPGTLMTIVSSLAIIISFYSHFKSKELNASE
ncbi:MAG: Uncharacterised protein [Bacteroidia bacterium]|jgi:hypothetical protein|nr:MAG: Uncharacterised protein [Bacteroidia bacterium]